MCLCLCICVPYGCEYPEARTYRAVYITVLVIVMLCCVVFISPLALISSNPLGFYLNPLKCFQSQHKMEDKQKEVNTIDIKIIEH